MHVVLDIPADDPAGRVFLTWTPIKATAKLVDAPPGSGPVSVRLRSAGTVGGLVFDAVFSNDGVDDFQIDLPGNGDPATFWIAGNFPEASQDYGDAAVEAVSADDDTTLGLRECMVRVRKKSEDLMSAERDRFLNAMARLNDSGAGRFADFRDMHTNRSTPEAHGRAGFLPWHRAYLLDLERELQAIDDTVALPYWRFDLPAPKLFSRQFIGRPDSFGAVEFSAGHPLLTWTTNGSVGINRTMDFLPNEAPSLRTQSETLALGGPAPNGLYSDFRIMEGNPHGRAHTSFGGFVSGIHTAARDPLFFMLHCNVDRLWGLWQWLNETMSPTGQGAFTDSNRIGHRLDDTMWPWNGVTGGQRPPTAPGGQLADSPYTEVPGQEPRVSDMLNFQAAAGGQSQYFAYDDVPFELEPGATV